ncbi:unnamed protein product [Protopolystoma xenopodis]|uniref:Uncharacterized protein n=1 Tax=Protopolystoma xenopodis TaxID=117903 RepID=A0A3S5FFD3_9PLAT|nr:unnamed protein product [Protopolystoma xenopodis]
MRFGYVIITLELTASTGTQLIGLRSTSRPPISYSAASCHLLKVPKPDSPSVKIFCRSGHITSSLSHDHGHDAFPVSSASIYATSSYIDSTYAVPVYSALSRIASHTGKVGCTPED